MTTPINKVALDVLQDVTGAPVHQVERDIRFAAIDFCDYTLAWRVPLADIPVVADTNEYAMTLPTESRIATVFYMGQDGIRLLPTSERALDDGQECWRSEEVTADKASWYFLPDRAGTVKLALTPSIAGTLSLTVALKPTQACKTLPDFLYEDHLEALRSGCLSRMLAQPGKEWTNPQLAAYYSALFLDAKRKEKAERWNDYTRQSSLSVLPINYYGSRRRSLNGD